MNWEAGGMRQSVKMGKTVENLTIADRILALLDHLGISHAHVAAQIPGDLTALVAAHATRVGGVVLCVPTRLDPVPFEPAAARVLMITSEHGMTNAVTQRAAKRLPGAKRAILKDYEAHGWSDTVAENSGRIADLMTAFLRKMSAGTPSGKYVEEGSHAGLTYKICGQGPALLLFPFFLAPSQWTAAIPALARHFTVITLGGAYVGGVAALEDRARAPTYQAMFRTLIDLMNPQPGQSYLDVGCGAGSLDRLLAKRLAQPQSKALAKSRVTQPAITAVDVNPFLLGEAAALAKAEGLEGAIQFGPGSAEKLPFADAAFDNTFSVTVLEECNADKAIAEMVRVTKPGGHVGVIVRSIDLPQWWSLNVPDALRVIGDIPPQSVAAKGVADASLYPRMRRAGLTDLVCFPTLVTLDRPGSPIWRYREDHVLSQLSGDKLAVWQAARARAEAAGDLVMAHPLHCAVGRKTPDAG
jgi:SAM-dependent methyltransferase